MIKSLESLENILIKIVIRIFVIIGGKTVMKIVLRRFDFFRGSDEMIFMEIEEFFFKKKFFEQISIFVFEKVGIRLKIK